MSRFDRRRFLKTAAGLGGLSMTSALTAMPAFAADTSGYKAMVCLFLRGGVDCHDMLLPADASSHARYSEIRQSMLGGYGDGGASRELSNLTALNAANNADFGSRRFALAPEMPGVRTLFEQGRAAIVANVGPLLQPTTREEFEANPSILPKRLFSHNDQQSTWSSMHPEGARYGWGGLMMDQSLQSGANIDPTFSVLSASGHDVFLAGQNAQPYQIGLNGPAQFDMVANEWMLGNGSDSSTARALIREHYTGGTSQRANLFERDMASAYSRAVNASELFRDAYENTSRLTTTFPTSWLGQQMRAIAESINLRGSLSLSRQIYIASRGDFDTHSGQAGSLPTSLGDIDAAISAFYQALTEMGEQDNVVLFTASEFGRTLSVNGDGTDHGWGGHHLVVGNPVSGGRIYGSPPPFDLDHDLDADQGRLIPTLAVEQYAGTLGRWFGLTTDELNAVMPNYTNFGTDSLGFV